MLLKGRYTPTDRPRNELEEEEKETVQYSQIHHYVTDNGAYGDGGEYVARSVEEDVDPYAIGSLLKQFLRDQLFIKSEECHAEVL